MSSTVEEEQSLLAKLDAVVPAPLADLDAFPKLPSTYKARSESRGFLTVFVGLLALLMMLNDIGEYIWGWPDYEFSVDTERSNFLNINVDVVVNMHCKHLSVDLRDAIGDRLYLSKGVLRRDGTMFDIGQATKLKEHAKALSARQAISQSRSSRGFFDTLFRRTNGDGFKPTYNFKPHGSACRVWGTVQVKKVTANLHITTLGHGYASHEHVDHKNMNLSHVISEFSFGPHFPDIVQPLDNSFEVTHDPFVAYQYFLHVVPTTYIAPRSKPLRTNQYSVTHYTRVLEHNRGTPGIFFKFDLDPMSLTIHQRTTSLIQLIIRCVGVVGGVFVCMGYAYRVTVRAVEVVTGNDASQGIVAAESTGVKVGLRAKWGGSHLRARSGKMVRQGNGWVLEGGTPGSPAFSNYTGTPTSGTYPGSPYVVSPSLTNSAVFPPSVPSTPIPGSAFGPPPPRGTPRTPSMGLSPHMSLQSSSSTTFGAPETPNQSVFPPSPNPKAEKDKAD